MIMIPGAVRLDRPGPRRPPGLGGLPEFRRRLRGSGSHESLVPGPGGGVTRDRVP